MACLADPFLVASILQRALVTALHRVFWRIALLSQRWHATAWKALQTSLCQQAPYDEVLRQLRGPEWPMGWFLAGSFCKLLKRPDFAPRLVMLDWPEHPRFAECAAILGEWHTIARFRRAATPALVQRNRRNRVAGRKQQP